MLPLPIDIVTRTQKITVIYFVLIFTLSYINLKKLGELDKMDQ